MEAEDGEEIPPDAVWRRMTADDAADAGTLALAMNNATNNASLVLAFELSKSGKVLLFVGDAQAGNWRSWSEDEFDDDGTKVTAQDLLARTVLYKVGHHGSHNATLKGKANSKNACLAWMAQGRHAAEFAAMITAVEAWAHAGPLQGTRRIDHVVGEAGRQAELERPHQPAGGEIVGDQGAAAEHDALAPDRRLDRVIGRQERRTAVRVDSVDPGAAQPDGPIDREHIVQERVAREIGGRAQRMPAFEQFRAADRKMIFLHQQLGRQTGILAAAAANGDVDPVADEIREPLRRRHPHVDIAVGASESRQPGHKPPRGERVDRADADDAEVCPVAADVAAARCSRTSRISAAKDAPTGVNRTERLARIISCTPR